MKELMKIFYAYALATNTMYLHMQYHDEWHYGVWVLLLQPEEEEHGQSGK